MGSICGTNNKRVIPKTKKAHLGLRSGQTISSQSVFQQQLNKKTQEINQIHKLDIQDEDLVNWDDPMKHCTNLLKPKGYKVARILKTTSSSITAEVLDGFGTQLIFKRSLFDSFDNASNNISYLYNMNKVSTDGLLRFTSLTISQFESINVQLRPDKTLYAIDRMIPKYNTLSDSLENLKLESLMQSLLILEQVSDALNQLHKEKFAYRFLRPESILTKDGKKFLLSNPSIQINHKEQKIIKHFVQQESDYYIYDCVIFSLLFLFLVDHKIYTFDSLIELRLNQDEWEGLVDNYKQSIASQFENDVPQMIMQLIEQMSVFDKFDIPKMSEINHAIRSVRQKGMQTYFKNDSLGAYLQYHKEKTLPEASPWLYFTKANQIHLYNYETNKFHFLKVYRKKQPFKIDSDVVYHPVEDKFFFFSHNASTFLLKVYDESHDRGSISQKREVELFRNIKNVKFEDPQLLVINFATEDDVNQDQPLEIIEDKKEIKKGNKQQQQQQQNVLDQEPKLLSKIMVMNQQQQLDEATQEVYFNSFEVAFNLELVKNDNEEDIYNYGDDEYITKKVIKIYQGPKNFQWHRSSFHFFDPHNNYIYCIPDYNNVFQNGIRYCYYDISKRKGNFKEGLLRFACSTDEIFKQFCLLNFKIKHIVYCIEVQHGVFLMQASKNMLILDFNFRCFYSLASLTQLQNFKENNKENPILYQNAYETRNQPFELKCLDAGGHNYLFQNGYLHCLARKEIETVHCVYNILPNQACIELLNCYSLHTNQDLLLFIPKTLSFVVKAQQKQVDESVFRRYSKHVRQYGVIKDLYADHNEAYLSAETIEEKQKFYLHQIKVETLVEVSQLFQAFNKKIQSEILLTPIEYFACSEEKNSFYMYYVNEEISTTLDSEVENRKLYKNPFEAKELALIVKIIFKALKELKDNHMEHGNLSTNSLCFTKAGIIKISGWYVANRKNFSTDIDDAVKVLYCLATLQRIQDIDTMDFSDPAITVYDGLSEFLKATYKLPKKTPYLNILNSALTLSKQLTAQNVDFNDMQSKAQAILWVGYGQNYIIITPLENMKDPRFMKVSILKPNQTNFKISKHCMFTFNFIDIIYISGAIKEDMKTQHLYECAYNKHKDTQTVTLKRLPDIPAPILSPSLLYAEGKIYVIGGYELGDNLNKQITDKVFVYTIKTKQWKSLKNLPINIYGGTALHDADKNIIYLFGGVSSEIDLTSDKLIYFTYDILKDNWEFNVDLSFKSPFVNSRFTKPIVDMVSPKLFISYYKTEEDFFIEVFELVKAGVSLKFKIKNPIAKKKNEKENLEAYAEKTPRDYERTLQDDLSMAIYKDSIYVLDEETQNLNIFRIKDVFHPQIDIVKCQIRDSNPITIHLVQQEAQQ
ncbi:unnamed protein product [Paramecium pentaurelia]|uniref:Protein kinase domain-containing protein n=1 Tax=Paramecium pentaurelia TaxID=43138 RepID=A0A8S1VAB2_9CILI|nr:unnamed protein product [Paramecium pentaurelia]